MTTRWISCGLLLVWMAGCASATPMNDASMAVDANTEDASVADVVMANDAPSNPLVAARPYRFRAPANYSSDRAWPLVVALHGYGANATGQDLYWGFSRHVSTRGFLYAYPEGTMDASGRRFWNASDACCDFGGVGVDDVAYIDAIIDDVAANYRVDPKRVFLIGHSNGGFMSHRYACDRSRRVAAIMSLAGAAWSDPMRCTPTEPVHVLQVHGTMDGTISYMGGSFATGRTYPSADNTVGLWAGKNQCGMTRTSAGDPIDIESGLTGAETRRERHDGCRAGGAAELWTIDRGAHIPALSDQWAIQVLDWLFAHPKP